MEALSTKIKVKRIKSFSSSASAHIGPDFTRAVVTLHPSRRHRPALCPFCGHGLRFVGHGHLATRPSGAGANHRGGQRQRILHKGALVFIGLQLL